MTALLSSAYFAPVQWFQKLNRYETVYVERFDSFAKQTYRNRCIISTANGLQALTVPVEHPALPDNLQSAPYLMRDIRVSDHGNWRHQHWNALQSAYGDSSFFLYYADDLRPFFEQRWKFLYDFNMEITLKMCELLDIHPQIHSTETFVKSPADTDDFREVIHPKRPLPDPAFSPTRDYQVYEQRFGFQPNLSILDLLFNQGNESVLFL